MDVSSSNVTTSSVAKLNTSMGDGLAQKDSEVKVLVKPLNQQEPSDVPMAQHSQEVSFKQDLDSVVNLLNQQMEKIHNYVKFERDQDTSKMIVFIKDVETDEVVRQIPSEEFLKMAKAISAYLESKNQISSNSVNSPAFPSGWLANEKV